MAKDIFTAEWFPYYFNRFEGSNRVALMSLAEEGAYHRAIRIAWEFGDVPSDPVILAARIQKRCTPKTAERVLSTFVPVEGDPSRSFHPVVEEIRREQAAKHADRVKGGKNRWKTDDDPPDIDEDELSLSLALGNQSQSQSQNQTKTQKEDFKQTDSCVRACVRDFPDVDPKLVEIAVIKTLICHANSPNAKPIRSTRYFREEIADMKLNAETKLGEKAVNAMLFSYRKKAELLPAKYAKEHERAES